VNVWTARVTYAGPDRLDITRKSAGPDGIARDRVRAGVVNPAPDACAPA
jgi:hypothetical protein